MFHRHILFMLKIMQEYTTTVLYQQNKGSFWTVIYCKTNTFFYIHKY